LCYFCYCLPFNQLIVTSFLLALLLLVPDHFGVKNIREHTRNYSEIHKKNSEIVNVHGLDTSKTEYSIAGANLYIRLPNNHWHLTPASKENPIQYIFKRDPIKDRQGRDIVPAIMVWFDAVNKKIYHGDLDIYKEQKITGLMNSGYHIDLTLPSWYKDYPLTFKKGVFHKGTYSQDGITHILYVMFFINKSNIGFQVAMDMTKDIAPKYEQEFWTTIRSLRNLHE